MRLNHEESAEKFIKIAHNRSVEKNLFVSSRSMKTNFPLNSIFEESVSIY